MTMFIVLALFASRRGDLDDDVSCSDFRVPSRVDRVCAGFIHRSRFEIHGFSSRLPFPARSGGRGLVRCLVGVSAQSSL